MQLWESQEAPWRVRRRTRIISKSKKLTSARFRHSAIAGQGSHFLRPCIFCRILYIWLVVGLGIFWIRGPLKS